MQKKQLYVISFIALVLVIVVALQLSMNSNDEAPPAEAFIALTQTRQALDSTATYMAEFPTPHPSMTYYGSECAMGSSSACDGQRWQEFSNLATRFVYEGTYVARTLTAQSEIDSTPSAP